MKGIYIARHRVNKDLVGTEESTKGGIMSNYPAIMTRLAIIESGLRWDLNRQADAWFISLSSEAIDAQYGFIKPGEQWKRERIRSAYCNTSYLGKCETSCMMEQSTDECFYEAKRVAPGYEVYRWTRIATLDDKPEELWASMDMYGTDIWSRKGPLVPEWDEVTQRWIHPPHPLPYPYYQVPNLQSGMLCKVKKVGKANYKIISVEECHLPIEIELRNCINYEARKKGQCRLAYTEGCLGLAPHRQGWGCHIPCLPNTHIQITCLFEEKKEKSLADQISDGPMIGHCYRNYCPQCGCSAAEPSDNFCHHCGAPLKGDC